MKKVLIVIPALNPPQHFINYVDELIQNGIESILVLDDGSSLEHKWIFDQIARNQECTVLQHALNLGKGRGIKNSINYFLNLENLSDYVGMIMVDSDGQHEINDVLKIRDAMMLNPNHLYFGSRNFDEKHVPWKSRIGNKFTTFLFKALYGEHIRDTQTGLRGIPKEIAHLFIDLKGERFQYEMNMLISAVINNVKVKEIDIKTVYFDDNSETHFRPIKDSLEIMSLIFANFFKYILSSLSSFIIDIILFYLMIIAIKDMDTNSRIILSTIIARIGSSIFNFAINKNIVFENKRKDPLILVRYFSLVLFQMLISASLVTIFYQLTGFQESFVKIVIDSLLFLVSYRIQKLYVFKESIKEEI